MNFVNAGLIFTPKVFIRCEKTNWARLNRGLGAVNFWSTNLLMHSKKLAYLQLITVLIDGSSTPKNHEESYLSCWQNSWKLCVNEFFLEPPTILKTKLFSDVFFKRFVKKTVFFHRTLCVFVLIVNRLFMFSFKGISIYI